MIRRNSQKRLRQRAASSSSSSTSVAGVSTNTGRNRSNSREDALQAFRPQLSGSLAGKAALGSRESFVQGRQKGDVMELTNTEELGSAIHFSDDVGDKVVTKLHQATPVVIQELMSKRAAFDDPHHISDLAGNLVNGLAGLSSQGIKRGISELSDPKNLGIIQQFIDTQPLYRFTPEYFPFLQNKVFTKNEQNDIKRKLDELMTLVFLRNVRARKIPDEIIIELTGDKTTNNEQAADQTIDELINDSNAEGLIKYRLSGSPTTDKNGNRRYRIAPDLANVPSDLLPTLANNSVFPDAVMTNENGLRNAYDSLFIQGAKSITDFKKLFPDLTERFGDTVIRELYGFQEFLWNQEEVEKELGKLEANLKAPKKSFWSKQKNVTWVDVEVELSRMEKAFGFTQKVVPHGILSSDLFLSLPMMGFSVLDIGAGIKHGELTHRLQWYAYMARFAESKGGLKVPPHELYRAIGWRDFREYATGGQRDSILNDRERRSLWAYLMDQVTSTNSDLDNQRFRFPNDMIESLTDVSLDRKTPLPKLSAALKARQLERDEEVFQLSLKAQANGTTISLSTQEGEEAEGEVGKLIRGNPTRLLHPSGITELLPEGAAASAATAADNTAYDNQMVASLAEMGQWAQDSKGAESASNSSSDE